MRRRSKSKKAKTKTTPVTATKAAPEEEPAALESETGPIVESPAAVETTLTEEVAAPMPVAEPASV